MSAKHTPGPWVIECAPCDGHSAAAYYIFGGGKRRAVAHIKRSTVQPMEANARLIAAAPDLLEALVVLVNEKADYMRRNNLGDPEREGATKQARAAISKATGGSS